MGLGSLACGRRRMGPDRRTLRCAVYTRKSSEHGLEQDFNSLHAQRESAEAYIKSQGHEGWKLVRSRTAKKLKLQESRVVIPSRRSLAACRPLGFFVRSAAPSWIGGVTA